MAYRIEPATYAHLPWLRLLFTRWTAEQPSEYPICDEEEYDNFVVAIGRHMNTNPLFACFVAIIGRRVVGFLAGEITDRAIGKPHKIGRAHWMYVVPKHRGKGVGKLLIAQGLSWLAERDCGVVELSEIGRNADAWEARGFTPFQTTYYLPTTAIFANLQPKSNGHDRDGIRTHGERQ